MKLKGVKEIDVVTWGYTAWIAFMIIWGFKSVERPGHHLLNLGMISIGIVVLIMLDHKLKKPVINLLRNIYPLLLTAYYFEITMVTNRVFFGGYIDPVFQRIDQLLFGYQPSIMWGVDMDYPWLQELMHFAYFCYYPLIVITPIYLYFKQKKNLGEFVFTTTTVFYLCFFIFSWLPVIGARAFGHDFIGRFPEIASGALLNPQGIDTAELTTMYRYGPFTRIMAFIYIQSPHAGGAFPSSHVAVAVSIAISIHRYMPKMSFIVIPIVILLCLSTVYCHYHYLIDVIGGLLLASIGYYLALKFYSKKRTNLA